MRKRRAPISCTVVLRNGWEFHARVSPRKNYYASIGAVPLCEDNPPYATTGRWYELVVGPFVASVIRPTTTRGRNWSFSSPVWVRGEGLRRMP